MKGKNPLGIMLASLLALGGAGIVINNYTEDDVMLVKPCITEDGRLSQDTIWIAESKPILKHTNKKYNKRSIKDSLIIVKHHSVTSITATAHDIAKIHVKGNNWAAAGYHFSINYKGEYDMLNPVETLSYHVRGSNTIAIGVLYIGNYENYKPTKEMIDAGDKLTKALKKAYIIKKVTVHNRVKGAATLCPGKYLEEALEERGIIDVI